MRLVSQNGEFDVPYENAVLSRTGNIIRVYVPIVGEKGTVMAQYSTEEQAKETMSMVLEADRKERKSFTFPSEGKTCLSTYVIGRYEVKLLEETIPLILSGQEPSEKAKKSLEDLRISLHVAQFTD